MEGSCRGCGRTPSLYSVKMRLPDGKEVQLSPGQFSYAYRESGEQVGLCDQCYRAGRLAGLTAEEIAYFRESFDASPESDDGA